MKGVSCLLSLESSSGASGIDIAGAPKSILHAAYTVLSGRHTIMHRAADDDDFALNVRFDAQVRRTRVCFVALR